MSARYLSRDGLRVRLVSDPDQTLAELTAYASAYGVELTPKAKPAR